MLGAAFPVVPIVGSSSAPSGLWPNGYRYRLRRIIPAAVHQMPSGGTDWVEYKLTDNALRSAANGGKVVNDADWPDLRFETGAGGVIKWERESWVDTTGALVAWLRLGGFISGVNYVVLLYYGKSGITADEADPAGCWAGYVQSVNMATGLDMSGNGRHFTLDGVSSSTIFGAAAGDFS